MQRDIRSVWIEAEEWAADQWVPNDSNSDVVVTLNDGSRWSATFVSYINIETLRCKNQETGECLRGLYFWTSNMILIDNISRFSISSVINDMLADGSFEMVFRKA